PKPRSIHIVSSIWEDPMPRALRPDTPAEGYELERRSCPRQLACPSAFVRYRHYADDPFQLATIWDISTEGIGLFVASAIEPETVLWLRFPQRTAVDRMARVVPQPPRKRAGWWDATLSGRWRQANSKGSYREANLSSPA